MRQIVNIGGEHVGTRVVVEVVVLVVVVRFVGYMRPVVARPSGFPFLSVSPVPPALLLGLRVFLLLLR